jgi:hypothetical protein
MANLTARQVQRIWDKIFATYYNIPNKVKEPALKTLEGSMKVRIFTDGKATNGRKIGRYKSKAYAAKRRAANRQTRYKDLEFYGDLNRNITVGKHRRDYVLGFANSKAKLIADGQEGQTRKTIFKPSTAELKELADKVGVLLYQRAKKIKR